MNPRPSLPQAVPDVIAVRQTRPCLMVHGLDHVKFALAPGRPVTLLSMPGAAISAGCFWWRALMEQGQDAYPTTPFDDILDCADAPGLAMAALRIGQRRIVLWPAVPAWPSVSRAAALLEAEVLPDAPTALDLGARNAARMLDAYLLNGTLF